MNRSFTLRAGAWPGLFETIGILAFLQSILLLIVWLLLCTHAGAEPVDRMRLEGSSYNPTKVRDPFTKIGLSMPDSKLASGGSGVFGLQGILYDPVKPMAIVNDRLVTLGKTVTLLTGGTEVQVRALEITREKVILEAGGQKIELRLNNAPEVAVKKQGFSASP